jgi:hypothetical protein
MLCEAFWKASEIGWRNGDDYLKYDVLQLHSRFCKSDTTTSLKPCLANRRSQPILPLPHNRDANKLERTGTYWLGAGLTALALYIATRPMPRAISAATAMPAGLLVGRYRIGHRTDEPRLKL